MISIACQIAYYSAKLILILTKIAIVGTLYSFINTKIKIVVEILELLKIIIASL